MQEKHRRVLITLVSIATLTGCPGDENTAASDGTSSEASTSTSDEGSTTADASTTTTTMPSTSTGVETGSESTADLTTTTTAGETTTGDVTSTTTGETGETGETETSGSSSSSGTPDEDVACVGRDGGDECKSPSDYTGDGECDPFSQDDCPDGQRCVPWANDGGNSWNSTRCSPIAAEPDAIGDACTVEGSGVSGEDSCEPGAMCWDVDGETNVGTCIEMCGCGPLAPTCNGMNVTCTVSNEGSLPICLPTCDPLLQDECPDGQGCYAIDDFFTCAPDASGDQGVAGSPCEFINACGPGLLCAGTAQIPGCVGTGCCTEFCDVDEGDGACSLPGTSCVPLFEPGTEPEACHADSGACLAP